MNLYPIFSSSSGNLAVSLRIALDRDLRSVSEQDFIWNGSDGGARGKNGGKGFPVSGSNLDGGRTINPKTFSKIKNNNF